jgi:hypothetical protein
MAACVENQVLDADWHLPEAILTKPFSHHFSQEPPACGEFSEALEKSLHADFSRWYAFICKSRRMPRLGHDVTTT